MVITNLTNDSENFLLSESKRTNNMNDNNRTTNNRTTNNNNRTNLPSDHTPIDTKKALASLLNIYMMDQEIEHSPYHSTRVVHSDLILTDDDYVVFQELSKEGRLLHTHKEALSKVLMFSAELSNRAMVKLAEEVETAKLKLDLLREVSERLIDENEELKTRLDKLEASVSNLNSAVVDAR